MFFRGRRLYGFISKEATKEFSKTLNAFRHEKVYLNALKRSVLCLERSILWSVFLKYKCTCFEKLRGKDLHICSVLNWLKNEFQQSFLPFHVYIQTISWARTEYTAVYPLCYFFKNNFSCKFIKDHMSFISKQRKFFSRILNFSSHYYTEENLILFSPFTLKLLLNCYF